MADRMSRLLCRLGPILLGLLFAGMGFEGTRVGSDGKAVGMLLITLTYACFIFTRPMIAIEKVFNQVCWLAVGTAVLASTPALLGVDACHAIGADPAAMIWAAGLIITGCFTWIVSKEALAKVSRVPAPWLNVSLAVLFLGLDAGAFMMLVNQGCEKLSYGDMGFISSAIIFSMLPIVTFLMPPKKEDQADTSA